MQVTAEVTERYHLPAARTAVRTGRNDRPRTKALREGLSGGSYRKGKAHNGRRAAGTGSEQDAYLWPMVKRLPAYFKLACRLIKEPAIPLRHRLPLYSVVLYEVSPPHLLIAAVPVLGQVDSVILFLLGLRHALAHCPPEVAARHLGQMNLTRTHMAEDWAVLRVLGRHTAGSLSGGALERLRFAARVAAGFGARTLRRALKV